MSETRPAYQTATTPGRTGAVVKGTETLLGATRILPAPAPTGNSAEIHIPMAPTLPASAPHWWICGLGGMGVFETISLNNWREADGPPDARSLAMIRISPPGTHWPLVACLVFASCECEAERAYQAWEMRKAVEAEATRKGGER